MCYDYIRLVYLWFLKQNNIQVIKLNRIALNHLKMEAKRTTFDEADISRYQYVQESCDLLRVLNDDCLLHVLQHLELKDIFVLSQCCRHVYRISDVEIAHRFRIIPVSVASHSFRRVNKYASVVRHLIINEKISSIKKIDNLRKLLKPYTNLEKLELHTIAHSKLFSIIDLSNIFSNLKQLVLGFDCKGYKWPRGIIQSTLAHCQ